jgi:hypothetical protein
MKYKISLLGIGEEFIVGSIEEEYYKFFKNNPISFNEFIDDTLNEILMNKVPDNIKNMHDLDMSSRFDHDDIVHANGAYHDGSVIVEVKDENGDIVYEAPVVEDITGADNILHETEFEDDIDIVNCGSRYVVIGKEWSKGLHDEFELALDSEVFDASKLMILYKDYDECSELISGVMYDGVRLESTGELGTSGKGSDWCIRDNKTLEEIR